MQPNIPPKSSPRRRNPLPEGGNRSRQATAGADLEFGRFRVLLRRRQLLADDVPVELGTRAFDVLMVLLEADGALVTKEELISRVWPSRGIGRKPQISGSRIAQSARRRPRSDSYGIRPRLSVHRRAAHECRVGALPANAVKAAVWPNLFPTQLSAFAPMQCQFDLVHLP